MKKSKKLASILSTVLLTTSILTPVYAESDQDNTEVIGNATQKVTVEYSKESNFTVTVPKNITLLQNNEKNGIMATYAVNVAGTIGSNEYVNVVPDAEITLHDSTGQPDATATVSQLTTRFDSQMVNAENGTNTEGTITNDNILVGDWHGEINFDITLNKEGEHVHIYKTGTVTQESTCTVEGQKVYKCIYCDNKKIEQLPKLEHSYVNGVCKDCGDVHVHSYDSGVVTTPATCTSTGVKTFTCILGDDTYTEEIPMTKHTYVDGVCKDCGDIRNLTEVKMKSRAASGYYYLFTGVALSPSDITEINFVPYSETLNHSWGDSRTYDLSLNGDKSIMCWEYYDRDNGIDNVYIAPTSDDYIISIDGYRLFQGLEKVKSIHFNKEVPVKFRNSSYGDMRMSYMFASSPNLTLIDFAGLDTSGVSDMFGTFNGCSSLTTLEKFSDLNFSKITTMDSIFSGCRSFTDDILESVLKSIDLSSVTNIRMAFSSCPLIANVDLSEIDLSNIEVMDYMFSSCKSLQTIKFSNNSIFKAQNMKYMFSWCTSLQTVDLSGVSLPNVTNMSSIT